MKPSSAGKLVGNAVRHQILDAANKHRIDPGVVPPYRMRHLQQAVNKCRRFNLVDATVLEAAGFRAVKRRG